MVVIALLTAGDTNLSIWNPRFVWESQWLGQQGEVLLHPPGEDVLIRSIRIVQLSPAKKTVIIIDRVCDDP